MKKIFLSIVAIVAIVAIAACTKSEVQYDAPQEISFAPVAKNATKAALAENAIPTTDIIVSANAGDAGSTIVDCDQPYFSEVTFRQGGTQGVFEAADCYWPNVQHLSFIGVTASEGISANNIEMSVNANTITISDYAQPAFTINNNDLMWFPSTTPQGKSNPTIGVEMFHACSWLQFYFKGDGVSGSSKPWKILSIDILSLSQKETATITGNNIVWSETCTVSAGTKKSYNVYK